MVKKRIFRKVFVLMMVISFITGLIILVVTTVKQTQVLEDSIIKENETLAKVAAKTIEVGYLDFRWPFETLKKISDSEENLFLWIVKPTGEIFLADDPKMHGKIIDEPFLGTEDIITKDSVYYNQKIKLIIHPLMIEVGKKPWTLFLGVSLESVEIAKMKTILTGFLVLLLVTVFITFISFYFSKGVVKPLEQLKEGVKIIGKGNLSHQIKIKTGDEIQELGDAFNQMTEELKRSHAVLEESKNVLEIKVAARTRELKELNANLGERVEERTKQLKERVSELEAFHRVTVGRETKMIELKNEIKELEKKLKEKNKS